MNTPSSEAVREALARYEWSVCPALPGRRNHRRAGVLVPLTWEPELTCVLTLRSSRLRKHAGEVCFPGGRPEPEDADLCATALREAREELGIYSVDVLGRLSSMPLYTSDYRLEPFVGRIGSEPLVPCADEVAAVIAVSIEEMLAAPHIDAIPFDWKGSAVMSPVFVVGGARMYGGTAHAFYELLQIMAPLFGRAVPPLQSGRWQWRDLLGDRAQ